MQFLPANLAQPRAAFTAEVSTDTTCSTVRLCGELDLATAGQLGTVLAALRHDGCLVVVLDLSGLDFLSAAGVSVLVRADAEFRTVGGQIVLTKPTPSTRRLLAITGLDTSLTLTSPAGPKTDGRTPCRTVVR